MEFCGGHTHAIFRFGLNELLPPNVELIHGPGCPVCVLPMGRMDDGLDLANGDSGLPISPFRSGMAGEDGNYNDAAQEAGSKGNG